jgi:HSP20 family protein
MPHGTARNRVREVLPGPWAEFDSLLQHLIGPQAAVRTAGHDLAASLWEEGEAYHLELDVPGVAREDVELTFEKGVLRVEVRRQAPPEGRQSVLDERRYGSLVRVFKLPETVDAESIRADLSHGVLHVAVSKRPESKPRKIEIADM